MPLARSLAMRYRRQTESLDDLVRNVRGGTPPHDSGLLDAEYEVESLLLRHGRDDRRDLRLEFGVELQAQRFDFRLRILLKSIEVDARLLEGALQIRDGARAHRR